MQYKCKTISIEKLPITPKGTVLPLCAKCKTSDCTNPIEKRKVNILGVTKELMVYVRGDNVKFVIECEGFLEK